MAERIAIQVDAVGNFNNLIGEVNKFKSQLQSLKLSDKVTAKLEKGFDNVESKVAHFQSLLAKGITTKGDFSKLISSAHAAEGALNGLKDDIRAIGDKDIRIAVENSADIKKAEEALQKVLNMEKQLSSFGTSRGTGSFGEKEVATMQKLANTSEGLRKRFLDVSNSIKSGNIDQASAAIERLIAHAQKYQAIAEKNGKDTAKWNSTIQWAQGVQQQLDGMMTKANQARASFEQLKANKFDQMKNSVNGIADGFSKAATGAKQYINATAEAAIRTNQLNEQVGHLRTQANYFFGLQNMGRLIARGIREAAESVRDLDKAMTETAVVTDFSVSDMWNMLPEYTALANKLGATTQGAYETMTLYFQQGLDKQQTFEIGEETMKMARIAGLDYAQTTNMMTAALRGFNMELNQVSAQRVNDVYSKLAAITASDTRELGLAMERTASIAHSANMDFGNTTAFLAQMIETTREAPENLGTAMKTIIARFQELKQNPYEISEVEGEEVDFNRIDKALKSIGVELMDNRDKFRDLDDVFMDISAKWDGLSQTTQRYVATMAAGSRQQSRFLAMVQNYDRLKELTDAAANSEGAATVQFNKTLESYEAKVNKLKNAWQAFTMSLANNQAVKLGVDTLQKIITLGNKIIEVFGKAGKAIGGNFGKTIGEMAAAFGLGALGFKGLQFGANTGLGLLARMTTGTKAGSKFFMGGNSSSRTMSAEAGMLYSKVTNPIVNAINNLATALGKGKVATTEQAIRTNELRQRQNNLYGMLTEERLDNRKAPALFSAKDVQKQLKGLTKEEQLAIKRNTPIISNALKNSFKNSTKTLNFSKEAQVAADKYYKDINTAISKGQMTYTKGLQQAFNPVAMGETIGGPIGEEIIKKAAEASGKYNSAKYTEKFRRQALASGLTDSKDIENFINKKRAISASKDPNTTVMGEGKANAQLTGIQTKMLGISRASTSAGQAVMGLGMALSSLGLNGAGAMLMTIGNGLIGIGMAASGASIALAKMKKAIDAIVNNPKLLLNPVGLAITAMTALTIVGMKAIQKHEDQVKKTRKNAKKVLSDYEKDVAETTQNINKLTDYKDTYATLSAGVDVNNNNISLGTAEYADYLQIINDIAKMHPELVKGYNAHGQAILKSNDAVREAIQLEKKRQREAEKTFTSTKSLDKLIAGRDNSKKWQKGVTKTTTNGYITTTTSDLKDDAQEVVDSIRSLQGGDTLLKDLAKQFGLTADDFINLSDAGVKAIQEHGATMLDQVQNNFKDTNDKVTRDLISDVQNSIAQVGKDTEGIDKAIEPLYKSLSTYASQQGLFDNIPDEFREAAELGIKEVAKLTTGEDGYTITGKEMQQRVQEVAQSIENLNGHSEQYSQILSEMDEAQNQFANDLDEVAYGEAISTNIGELMRWRDEALDIYQKTGDESQRIISESLQNQIEAYDSFVRGSTETLADGFNEQAAQLERAAHAAETFQKKTENINDYYTGADNMKSILDEIKDGIDDVGKGSRTFWAGAEELLGEKFIKGNNFDTVNKQLENIKGMFYDAGGEALEAQQSANKFLTYLKDHQSDDVLGGLSSRFKEIGEVLNVTDGKFDFEKARGLSADQFEELANSLGMSDQLLASMLNKAAQFYNIDFSNADVLRKNLAVSENAVAGKERNGVATIYTKRSSFEAEAEAEGYTPPELENLEKQLKDKGVKLLSDVGAMGMKELQSSVKDMGIKSGEEFIKTFSDLGYNKSDIQTLYDKLLSSGDINQALKDKIDLGDKTFGEAYNDMLNERDLEEDKSAEEATADNTSQLVSNTSAIAAAVGALNVNDYDKNKTGTLGANGKEYYKGVGFNALKDVYGGDGRDTEAQNFAIGKNKNGTSFESEQEYQNHYNRLLQMKQNYDSQAAQLEIAAQQTSDKTIADRYTRQAEYLRQAANGIDDYIKKGEEAHQKHLQQNSEEQQSDNETAQNKANNNQKEINSDNQRLHNKEANNQKETELPQETITKTTRSVDQLNSKLNEADGKSEPTITPKTEGVKTAEKDVTHLNNQLDNAERKGKPKIEPEDSGVDGAGRNIDQLNSKLDEADRKSKIKIKVDDSSTQTGGRNINQLNKRLEQAGRPIPKDSKNNTSTYTVNVKGEDKVENLQKKLNLLNNLVKKGGTYKLDVSGVKSIKSAANAAKTLTKNTGTKTIGVKTGKADTSSVTAAKKSIGSSTAKINVGANTSPALAAAETARKKIDSKKATIDVSINQTGSKTVTINVKKKGGGNVGSFKEDAGGGAKGINNKISYAPLPSFGSVANGTRYGKVGPKGKGGLTLTGEKGFEIAWIPSESKSMILGADGPQMLNLPSDAVVYTHEQSKKIIKQKAIPAQSRVGGKDNWDDDFDNEGPSSSGGKGKGKSGKGKSKGKKGGKWIPLKTPGKVSVWWDNQIRKVEAVQRAIDKLVKKVEKGIKEIGMTLNQFSKQNYVKKYLAEIQEAIKLNKESLARANRELNNLDNKGRATVSYKQKYRKKGSKKTKEETKKARVNLGKYIKYDAEHDTYIIDQDAIDKVAKKNKSKAKAIKEAANQKINDKLSKRNTAEDNIEKAQEALDKFAEDLYNAFFGWENELTRIWNLTKQIENSEHKISRIKELQSTFEKQLATGLAQATDEFNTDAFKIFQRGLEDSFQKIQTQFSLLDAQKNAVIDAFSANDEEKIKQDIQNKLNLNSTYSEQAREATKKQQEAKQKAQAKIDELEEKRDREREIRNARLHILEDLKKKKARAKTAKEKKRIQKAIEVQQKKIDQATANITNYNAEISQYKSEYNAIKAETDAIIAEAQNYILEEAERLAYETQLSKLGDRTKAQGIAQKYLTVTQNGDGTIDIDFDSEQFENDRLAGKLNDSTYEAIKSYIDKLLESNDNLNNTYQEINSSINGLYDDLAELQEQWVGYAEELWDISEAETKQEIDNFKKLSESITNALKKLLDEVKRKLDERRQREDNANTEREIAQKQQRLAALRADTAGGHQVEIAQLEKEIAEAQQNYQRTLEDQLLEQLQHQADLAAEQRERLIELEEAILEGTNNAALVDMWMADPENFRDEIEAAYKTANDYDKKPLAMQEDLDRKFESMMSGLVNNQREQDEIVKVINDLKPILNAIKQSISDSLEKSTYGKNIADLETQGYGAADFRAMGYTATALKAANYTAETLKKGGYTAEELRGAKYTAAELKQGGYTARELRNAGYEDSDIISLYEGQELKDAGYTALELKEANVDYEKLKGVYTTDELAKAGYEPAQKLQAYNNKIAAVAKDKKLTAKEYKNIQNKAAAAGLGPRTYLKDLVNTSGLNWKKVLTQVKKAKNPKAIDLAATFTSDGFKKAFDQVYGKGAYKKYRKKAQDRGTEPLSFKQGGLADFTGPAWLDGTASKPELVLNAQDTKNFLALRDVLGKAINSTGATNNSYDNANYEININVDHIANDYDVDRMAERIKKDIIKSAGYRNVNQVRNFK